MGPAGATPLIALDALALDTETTGLDARKAAIVEIALVPVIRGQLDTSAAMRRLIRPAERIPEEATRIHGIDDRAVAAAPAFAEAWPELSRALGGRVLVGHSIGYDLAVLQRECERAVISWSTLRALDVRLLAEVAAPNLPDYALEGLAAWLGIACTGRHSAAGDATVAGHIFLALIPLLRERGIRTLAEAERACAGLTAARDAHHRAGWMELGPRPSPSATGALVRLDSTPYRYRVEDVMSAPPLFVDPSTPLREIVARMMRDRVSSLFVARDEIAARAQDTGIVTERDAMRAIADRGGNALEIAAGEIARRPLVTVSRDALMFVAIARMSRLNIRHLGVADDEGRIVGALSARDLLRLRAEGAVALGDEIFAAEDAGALARAWARLPEVAAGLLAEGLSGREIATVVSHQLAALTERAAVLAEQRLDADGLGKAPCPYAFCVLGSAGRGESLLAMDQDNALVFADGGDAEANDRWFAALAGHVTAILHDVGVPYCKGGIMATNARWRGSLSAWRERIQNWIRYSKPEDLLAVDIFYDMRGVAGDVAMAEMLWRESFDAARGQAEFAKLLASSIGEMRQGLNFFGNFRTDGGRLDIKQSGLFGVVSLARALSICHHVVARGTPERLAGLTARDIAKGDLEAMSAAQEVFLDLLVAQQVHDIRQGIPPSNTVEIKRLSRGDKERLRRALKSVAHIDQVMRDHLF